jgi:N-acetylneuraminic acid mutarotase
LLSDAQSLAQVEGTASSPSARVGTASATLGGKVYLFSGRGGEAMAPVEEQGAVWELNPSTMAWTLLSPLDPSKPFPPARSYHCSASNNDDKIFIHAGCPDSGRLADLWSFAPSSRTWAQLAQAPAPSRGGTSIAFYDGLLYRMNGFDGKIEQGGSLDIYDLASDTWSTRTYVADGISGPTPRSVSACLPVAVSGRPMLVTLFGERDPSSLGHQGAGKMLGDVWAYDIASNVWSEVETRCVESSDGPTPRGWFDADIVDGSAILVVGGLGGTNERLSDAWLLQLKAEA